MSLNEQLKRVIIEGLDLEDVGPEEIQDDEALFGEGLGLDSLDAVELVVIVKREFGVEIKDMNEGREAFRSLSTLVAYIEEHRPA
jgi:acyl carrier protein